MCEPGTAVRVSPAGVCCRRALPQPELQQTSVSKNGGDQNGDVRLGPQNQTGSQKGQSEIRTSGHDNTPVLGTGPQVCHIMHS